MSRYADGTTCPRCGQGKLASNDAWQTCSYCGRIFYTAPATIPFQDLAVGEEFYSNYSPDSLRVKLSDCHPRDGNNWRGVDKPAEVGNCGPLAPCIRAGARTMKLTPFTYN